jgi:hypothetical protein
MARFQIRTARGTFDAKRGGMVTISDPASSHHGERGGIVGVAKGGRAFIVAYVTPGEGRRVGTYGPERLSFDSHPEG